MTDVPATVRRDAGFVLAAAIWMLAALVLFVGYVASSAESVQGRVLAERASLEQRLAARSTLASLLYLGATQPVTYAGLTTAPWEKPGLQDEFNPFSFNPFVVKGGELRLDDRPYHGAGGVLFAVQDTGALVSLLISSAPRRSRLVELLEYHGLAPRVASLLVSRLEDYIDRDTDENLSGMEDYADTGLPAPTNRLMSSPTQLLNLPGWSEALGDGLELVLRDVTIYAGNRPNFNSLRRSGMVVIGNLEEDAIARLMAHREQQVFNNLAEINQVAGTLILPNALPVMPPPDSSLRVRLWREGQRHEEWIGIRFTPQSATAPWEIDYRIRRPRVFNDTDSHALSPGAPESHLFR